MADSANSMFLPPVLQGVSVTADELSKLNGIVGGASASPTSPSVSAKAVQKNLPAGYEYQNNLLNVETSWSSAGSDGLFPNENFTVMGRIYDTETRLFLVRNEIDSIYATVYRNINQSINFVIWNPISGWNNVSVDPKKTFFYTEVPWRYDPHEWNFVWKPDQTSTPMFARTGMYMIQIDLSFSTNRLPLRFTCPITISK